MVQDITLDDVTTLTVASFDRANGICDLLESHGYTINALPGEFIKVFTMNANEIAELEQVLNEIDALNLKDVFQNNLRVVCFKKVFLDRLKVFLTNNLAFLNEDNTFISELYNISFASRIQFCIDNGFIFMNGNKQRFWSIDDFEVGAVIGEGRFGKVFVAKEKKSKFLCVLKILQKAQLKKYKLESQVISEIEIHLI